MSNYTIPGSVLAVVADATATYELATAVLREARADVDAADLAVVVRAAARAKGAVDMLDRLVDELGRTGRLPQVLGLVGGRLGDGPPSDVLDAYCQGAGTAVALVMSAARAVAA